MVLVEPKRGGIHSALDLDDYAHKDTHLSKEQQEKLICSIQEYPKLF